MMDPLRVSAEGVSLWLGSTICRDPAFSHHLPSSITTSCCQLSAYSTTQDTPRPSESRHNHTPLSFRAYLFVYVSFSISVCPASSRRALLPTARSEISATAVYLWRESFCLLHHTCSLHRCGSHKVLL